MIPVHQTRGVRLLPILAIFLSPSTLAAPSHFTEEDLLQDIAVVSAVSSFEQRLEQAPASVTIISRDLIEKSGAQSFVDIFRLVPGFQAYQVNNNRFGISYHGIGREFPNQMEVMVDGRSVYETLFSTISWGTLGIELTDIDYIEVVRGSNAAAQGSNAFMGSINIVTRKPVQDGGLGLYATVGDLQTRNTHLRYSDTLGLLDYRLTLGYQRNNGFPATPEGPLEDGRELSHANFRGTYTPTVQDTLEFYLGHAHDRLGWGDADHPDEFSLAHSSYNFQSLKWLHNGADSNDYQLHAYHNSFRTRNYVEIGVLYNLLGVDKPTADFIGSLDPIPSQIVGLFSQMTGLSAETTTALLEQLHTTVLGGFGDLESERFDLEFSHHFRLSDTLRGTWGAGARYDSFSSYHPQSFTADVDETSFRLYNHNEWRVHERLIVNAGAMAEDTYVGTLVSPRFSLNFLLSPQQTVRVGYARGNRAPSLLEANEDNFNHVGGVVYDILRVADSELMEEKLESFEIAYLHQSALPGLSYDLRFFREKVTEVIDEITDFTPPEVAALGDKKLKRVRNGGYWRISGAEFQLNYHLTESTFLRAHYTYADLVARQLPDLIPGAWYLPKDNRMATHSGGLLISQRLDEHWLLSASAYHQSGLRFEDGDDISAYTRIDAQVSYYFNLGRSRGSISLVAQNLGNDYAEFNDNNIFETRFFLTANLAFPD